MQIGTAVNAKWTDNKFYGAFITVQHEDGTYDCYFPCDSSEVKNVMHEDIKIPMMKGKTTLGLSQYEGKVFYDEGDDDFESGEFQVKCITTDNNFICSRLFGDKGEEVFDIGYVIRRVRLYEEE